MIFIASFHVSLQTLNQSNNVNPWFNWSVKSACLRGIVCFLMIKQNDKIKQCLEKKVILKKKDITRKTLRNYNITCLDFTRKQF